MTWDFKSTSEDLELHIMGMLQKQENKYLNAPASMSENVDMCGWNVYKRGCNYLKKSDILL